MKLKKTVIIFDTQHTKLKKKTNNKVQRKHKNALLTF